MQTEGLPLRLQQSSRGRVFAEFETAIRKERQMEGITAAKAAGVYKGRSPSIKPDAVAALKAEKIGRASVYWALDA
jgi:DNA invertase Pin-like site-specific DNA recombinase